MSTVSHSSCSSRALAWILLCALTTAAACDDGGTTSPASGGAHAGLAIVSSNYTLSSVSLYDPKTGTIVDDCVPTASLSKDVVLPSGTQNGELVVIDRFKSLIKFVTPSTCAERAQLSVSTGGFMANPHDVVYLSATKAYVTRYNTNAAPTADPADFDEGDDLLVIDPSMSKVVKRISLTSSATSATLQAAPDRAILANGKVYVTLNNLAGDFSSAGPGRVAVVDPATDTVTGVIDLPEQTGCSGIDYDAATKRLFVSCGGEFSDGAQQTAKSAFVEIDLSTATPTIARTIHASALGTRPISYQAAPVVGDQVFVTTMGDLDFATGAMLASDNLFAAGLGGATPTKILDGGAYTLGRAAVDTTSKTLFLPDGNPTTPRVRLYDLSAATPAAGTPFEPNPAGHLPPREAAWY